MTPRYIFLLVYLLGCDFGASTAQSNATCTSQDTCGLDSDPTSNFLQCVGLPSTDTGKDHMQRLKGMLEATMDVYTFLRSSIRGVPLLSLQGELLINPAADPLQNEDLVNMWLEVKIKPLIKSITKQFLSCLSTKNFSCSTYQTVVRELSNYYSEMDPVRQNWTYTFFMVPFLSGDNVAGCVNPQEGSEEWLLKNFGAFRAAARIKDFSTLNMNFSGLDVLHLLSGAQKAELLLLPELQGLDNGTLALVLHSLLTGGSTPAPSLIPEAGNNWTTPGYPSTNLTYDPYLPPSPDSSLREIVNGFTTAFRPIRSFVHEFVSFTQTRNVSEIRSTTLTQFLFNWTLAELAGMYRPQNMSVVPETPTFDVTSVEDWYQKVVMPVLIRIIPNDAVLMHQNIRLAFEELFYLDYGNNNESSEIEDVCSITLDKSPCGLTNAVENLAHVLHCAAQSNLTVSETTIMGLIVKLTKRLNLLIEEFSKGSITQVVSDFQQTFSEAESPSLTQQHMEDPTFIKLWYQIKLRPLLPNVPPALLSCLSTKNFSCSVYQTIIEALSKDMSFMDADAVYSQNIYKYFIYPFLLQHNTSGPQCFSNQSAEWLINNFGFFSRFAPITDFYKFNPHFSGLQALHVLSPQQLAELLLLPLPTPPGKDVVISEVFGFLVKSPEQFPQFFHFLVQLAIEVDPPCSIYEQIFESLYGTIQSLPPAIEPVVWGGIHDLMNIAPVECVPQNVMCPLTLYNATSICTGINSSDVQSYLNTSMNVSCSFPLEKYACAQLENFTANQLVSLLECNLPGNSSHSKVLWKMLLSKLSYVLDPALDILANMPMSMVGSSVTEVLDVISEMRLSVLKDEQLTNSSVIDEWFSSRLSRFLPFASGGFLTCLSHRNLSCQSYQHILQVFSLHFGDMTSTQQSVVFRDFIHSFLFQPNSGPGCVNTSTNSTQWLHENLGPFSVFASLRDLINLNPRFNPLEVLPLLTPEQTAELLVLTVPTLTNKDVIINTVFDFLTEPPRETQFSKFLVYLVMFLPQGNLSCSSYQTLFARLNLAMASVSLDLVSSIISSKNNISQYIPPGCTIYVKPDNGTVINETVICAGVNSTTLQLYLNSGQMNGRYCNFSVEQFACASLSALTAQDLAAVLKCNRSSNLSRPAWKLFLTKASPVLDAALDLLSNQILDPNNPAVSVILDTVQELRLNNFSTAEINDPSLILLWFRVRLYPFLPSVSPSFLSHLATTGLNCSTYQLIVQILNGVQPNMTLARQVSVYTNFIQVFLTRNNTADPSCSLNAINSSVWMQKNLGGFSVVIPFQDLQILYPQFSPMEALSQLSPRQLAALSATPGLLTSPAQVNTVMSLIPNQLLPAFFDDFSSAIVGQANTLPSPVRSALLQVVFDRVNLTDSSVSDSVVTLWLSKRLPPLLLNLSQLQVAPLFTIWTGRNCSIGQQGVVDLNNIISTLSEETKKEIYSNIIQTLQGPTPLRCYGDNYNISFYSFLELSFKGFQFPNLTTFLSLMPQDRMHQLLNSIPPAHLGAFLNRPGVVDNSTQLCVLYNNYIQTPVFLKTESLPAVVKEETLPCVWPMALQSSTRSDINAWFDQSLKSYLAFLTRSLISPEFTSNASCLAFQKFVSVLGGYNYTSADFMMTDVYDSIRSYLSLPASEPPRCYNSSNPDLNSTAWFVDYIGPFMSFLTLEDLQAFGSAQVIQVFTVNLLNIALLNQTTLPLNVTSYYTELVYQENVNFNPLLLPLVCRCSAPGPAFSQLSANESMIVLHNLTTVCTNLDPQIAAALASNLGNNMDAASLAALGNESTGLSTGQIQTISPATLYLALTTLSSVSGWNYGQANAIIQALMSSGLLQVNSSSSLFMLGSLVVGLPSTVFQHISGSQLISASTNPSFLVNLMSGPQIIRETFVTQIISVNTNSESIIQNVPNQMATEIPRSLLLGFSNSNSVITTLNQKEWKKEQVELFFSVIGTESAVAVLGSPSNLSSSVLQGFTCTGVSSIQTTQINKLIKACRRTGNNRVQLVETQLTCMYNYIKGYPDVTNFTLYPPDVMLYYDYSLVPQASCRLYFQQLANANFFVFSSTLSYKLTTLFANARSCLGITNTSLTKDNILVLGNMCCTLDGSYIQNSDPYILETLKNCPDLTSAQAAAVQTMLLSGNTQYGAPSTWNSQTLLNLGMLPLYLTSTFYKNFNQKTKQQFMKYFLNVHDNAVSIQKRRTLKEQIRLSIVNKSKRSAVSNCTVGIITQVTISDDTFPFNYYDVNQFDYCLTAATVKDNLDAITQKVDQLDYLSIVLSKLQEAYGASATIPENQVQLLGPASRVASVDNINLWNITQIDTLSALMSSKNGPWDPSLANAVISKYLSNAGNKLGSAELNAIGVYLCSLDVSVLMTISQQSLKDASALNISNCTTEKQNALFNIAVQAFAPTTRASTTVSSYQLIQPYMSGANLSYILDLLASNVSMDLATFISLPSSIVMNLTVSQVQRLLGSNLPDLVLYQNQSLVRSWIRSQPQIQLDSLGLGLVGGLASSTNPTDSSSSSSTTSASATGSSSSTTTAATATTTSATSTSSTTKGNGTNIRADAGFSFLVLLFLFIITQHMVV